ALASSASSSISALADAAIRLAAHKLRLVITMVLALAVVIPVAAAAAMTGRRTTHLAAHPVVIPASAPALVRAPPSRAGVIKVGWIVSEETAKLFRQIGSRNEYEHVTYIRPRLLDPQIELYAVLESGSTSDARLA